MNPRPDDSSYRSLFLTDSFPSALIDLATNSIREVNAAFEELTSLKPSELRGRCFEEVLMTLIPGGSVNNPAGLDLQLESSESAPWKLVRLRQAQPRREPASSIIRLAAGISHDFNNVLMSALPWSDVLRRRHQQDAGVQTATGHIQAAIFRARDLTSALRDFAEPPKSSRDIHDLRLLARQWSLEASRDPDILIQLQSPTRRIPVLVDRIQIFEVFDHLWRNAFEAIGPTGTVRIRVGRVGSRERAKFKALPDHDLGVIEVSDDGHGMTTDVLEQAFDPFFSTRERRSRTGLGLAIVARIAEEHGGRVRAESRVGCGTTIRLFLPLSS